MLVASSATPFGEDAGHETAPVAPPPPPAPPVPAGETASAETPSGGDGGGGGTEATTAAGAIGAGPELGMSTAVGEEGRRAAARRTVHAEDSALLEDISFVQRDLENPGKLQVFFFFVVWLFSMRVWCVCLKPVWERGFGWERGS